MFLPCVTKEFENDDAAFPKRRSRLRDCLDRADCEVEVQETFRQDGAAVQSLDEFNVYMA